MNGSLLLDSFENWKWTLWQLRHTQCGDQNGCRKHFYYRVKGIFIIAPSPVTISGMWILKQVWPFADKRLKKSLKRLKIFFVRGTKSNSFERHILKEDHSDVGYWWTGRKQTDICLFEAFRLKKFIFMTIKVSLKMSHLPSSRCTKIFYSDPGWNCKKRMWSNFEENVISQYFDHRSSTQHWCINMFYIHNIH